jgi:Antitoxin VbhA
VVKTAVADNVLEGWDPTPADLGLLADYAVGEITAVQYRAAVIAAASA